MLARVPGRMPGKALLLAAHYDSTRDGPGAADDGASVAAILETLRALKSQPALQNDLICIFTDGEEAGLLGAEAFVVEHPWAKEIGLVLNFEYRGNRGPFLMFETSRGNGKLIAGLAQAAPHPLGNSLMYEVYQRMPFDTDMTVFKRAGMAGMNFAAIAGFTSYHTQLDRPELLHEGSLQHQGEILLALAQHFGNIPLDDLQSGESIYFAVPILGMVHYPVSWAVPLCAALVALFGVVLTLGLKSGELRADRTALGSVIFLLMLAAIAAACQLLWLGIRQLHPEYQSSLQWDTYNSHWYLLAFVLLVIGTFALIQAAIQRWLRSMELAVGAMACWLVFLIAASIWLPVASFLFAWPLAAILLALGILCWQRRENISPPMQAGLLLVGAVPAIIMVAPLVQTSFVGLTPQLIGVVMALLLLLLGLLAPLVEILMRHWLLPWLPLVCAILFLAIGSWSSSFDAAHPRHNNLFYALEGATGKAFWLSTDESLDRWTRTFFPGDAVQRKVPEIFGDRRWRFWAAPAPAFALLAPAVEVLADSITANVRKINLQIRSLRHAPEFDVYVEGAEVLSSRVQGRIFSPAPLRQWRLDAFGIAEEGLNIELKVKAGTPFKIRVIDFSLELPPADFPPRPADMIPQPFGLSDTTAVVRTVAFE